MKHMPIRRVEEAENKIITCKELNIRIIWTDIRGIKGYEGGDRSRRLDTKTKAIKDLSNGL
jgi:hypothetical protein